MAIFTGEINRNCPWGNIHTGLTREGLQVNCLKYAQRGKENHVQRAEGNQENNISANKNINTEIKILKNKHKEVLELKSIPELKISLEGFNGRFE